MRQIPEGEYTERIYGYINDKQYDEAIKVLSHLVSSKSNSRPALSLLAYCYYYNGNFNKAAETYSQLVSCFPEVDIYRLYHAQALYKAGLLEDSLRVAMTIDTSAPELQVVDGTGTSLSHKALLLQSQIRYEVEELAAARALLEDCDADDPNTSLFQGAIDWKEKNYQSAYDNFVAAQSRLGDEPEVLYNLSLCHYSNKNYSDALKCVCQIVESAVLLYPHLKIGIGGKSYGKRKNKLGLSPSSDHDWLEDSMEEDEDEEEESTYMMNDYLDLTNPTIEHDLQKSRVVEALNMRIALQYISSNDIKCIAEALEDLPRRREEDIDAISLHNSALVDVERKPSEAVRKFSFLLQNTNAPQPTFVNLLLLFCQNGKYEQAADLQADNIMLTYSSLQEDDYSLLEALILSRDAPADALDRFEALTNKHLETLNKIMLKVRKARKEDNTEDLTTSLEQLEETVSKRLIPALIGQGKIFWEAKKYDAMERIFRQHSEFCSDNFFWQLYLGHTFFMKEMYQEALLYYEPIVEKHKNNLLSLKAVVLTNICVSYIMLSRNEQAEDLMRLVEAEEEMVSEGGDSDPSYHFSLLNLIIGVLYCSKGIYDFGIDRVINALDTDDNKITFDTWYYAKRALLSCADLICKHIITIKTELLGEIHEFLDRVMTIGREMPKNEDVPIEDLEYKNSIAFEASTIKGIYSKFIF